MDKHEAFVATPRVGQSDAPVSADLPGSPRGVRRTSLTDALPRCRRAS